MLRSSLDWINVRDPSYFSGCEITYTYVKRIHFLPRVMWARYDQPKVRGLLQHVLSLLLCLSP